MIKKIKSFLFENTTAKQTVAKNTFWLGIGTVASRIIKALIIIYAARVLGAENYGVFSYALSLAALFSILSDLGMSAVLTREASRSPENLEKNLGTSFVIKLSATAFSFALVAFIAPFFSNMNGVSILMPLAAFLIAFDSLRDFAFSVTRAKERMELEAAISMTTGVAITVFGFAAIFISPTPLSLMTGYVMGSAVGFFLAYFLLRDFVKNIWKNFDRALAKKLIKEAAPLALMSLLGALTINTDTLMIGWLKSATDVGLYAAAQRPVLLIYLIASLLGTSIFPLISRIAHKDNGRVRYVLEKTIPFSLLMAMPIFVGGTVLSKPIVLLIFGTEYLSSYPSFATLLFTVILLFPATIILNAIFAYGAQKTMLYSMALGGISNIILDLLLIPPFGILGSAFATVLSQGMAYGWAWIKMKQINNFETLKHLKKIIFSSVLMGIFAYILNSLGVNIILNISLSIVFYFSMLFILKEKLIEESLSILKMRKEPVL